MDAELQGIVEGFRRNGVPISDREAEDVLRQCVLKMDSCKIGDREAYLPILYEDEVRNYLFRRTVNAITELRKMEEEWKGERRCAECAWA